MANMTITSFQQYSLDRFRINLNTEYMISVIQSLSITLTTKDGEDVTNTLHSVTDSNQIAWESTGDETATYFDLYLKPGTQLTAGTYHFTIVEPKSIYCEEKTIFDEDITINHMEDVRINITNVERTELGELTLTLSPIRIPSPENPEEEKILFQSQNALDSMTLSIVDGSNLSYGDAFQPLSKCHMKILSKCRGKIDEEQKNGTIQIPLKAGKSLPAGRYQFRFVNTYKNRTLALYTTELYRIPYLTTVSPKIESARLRVKDTGDTVLSISFGSAPEISVFEKASYGIIHESGKDVTNAFNKIEQLLTDSRADTNHILRTDYTFIKESYTLNKGNYILKWNWNDKFIENQKISFDTGWMLRSASKVTMNELKDVVIQLSTPVVKEFIETAKYAIELNGVDVDSLSVEEKNAIYGAFGTIRESTPILEDPYLKEDDPITELRIRVKDKSKLRQGEYNFLLYTETNGSDREYKIMAPINIAEEIKPVISEVKQITIDEIRVMLEKPCPVDALELTTVHLVDVFSNTDLSDQLETIGNSNVWDTTKFSVSEFEIRVKPDEEIPEGEYNFFLQFMGSDLRRYNLPIQYMSKRKGHISKVEQVDLEHIKISFSETQSREFLLQTKLKVSRMKDGADFTERFVLLDIALKEYGYAVDDVIVRMDWEDSFPRGRYLIQLLQVASLTEKTIVYEAEADLDHMTNNKPAIGLSATDKIVDSRNVQSILMMFTGYIESVLYEKANVVIKNSSGTDVTSKFLPKEQWTIDTAEKQEIRFTKNITAPLFDQNTKMTADTYTITFSWDGELSYVEDVSTSVYMKNVVPWVIKAEMVSPTRAYFEFPNAMQESWIRTLQFDLTDKQGKPADLFKSVTESNNIVAGMSTDNINLDLKEGIDPVDELHEGSYTFIFYHVVNDVKESDFAAKINVKGTVYPLFAGGDRRCRQEGINFFTFRLRSPISTDILQSYSMKVFNKTNEEISNWFQSITKSNPWEEDDIDPTKGGAVREVSEFDLKLKGRSLTKLDETLKISNDSLRFQMISSTGSVMDECWFDVEYAEGVMYELDGEDGFKQKSLKELTLKFQEEQSKAEFRMLSLVFEQIVEVDANNEPTKTVDRSNLFRSLSSMLSTISTDYFETISLVLDNKRMLPSGKRRINGEEVNYGYLLTLMFQTSKRSSQSQRVFLEAPMTTEYPAIHEVAATEDTAGNKGIIITFKPFLAKELFDTATLKFRKRSNDNFDLLENGIFYPRLQWGVEVENMDNGGDPEDTDDDIPYVKSLTIPFNSSHTLDRDNYVIEFKWLTPSFMDILNMRKEVRLDYILKPLAKVEVIGIGKIELTFKDPLKQSYLLGCQLEVEYSHMYENEDGFGVADIDVTELFEPLTTSNQLDFPVDEETNEPITIPDPIWTSVVVQLKPNTELPKGDYTFRIGELLGEPENDGELKRIYSGTKNILFLQNIPTTVNAIRQGGLDFVYVTLNDFRNVDMVSDLKVTVKGMSDGVDYSGYFSDILSSNEYKTEDQITNYFANSMERGLDLEAHEFFQTPEALFFRQMRIKTVKTFRLALDAGRAIPAGDYTFILKSGKIEYGRCIGEVTFMTTTPPEISGMYVDGRSVVVDWLPNAEETSLNISNFIFMTNHGFNDNGDVIGEVKTTCLSPLSSATKNINPQGSINYVPSISLPVVSGVSMPAGTYTMKWKWNSLSYMKDVEYTGALHVISEGVKKVMLSDEETIHVEVEVKKAWSYFKTLEISVMNEKGEDFSDSFQTMEESNPSITEDKTVVKEFDIKLEDGEDVLGGTYTFSLQSMLKDEDGNDVMTPDYVFSITIVFMTTEFGDLSKVDNLSADEFELVELKNDKDYKKEYIGKFVELLTVPGHRECLGEANYLKYCGKSKYGPPNAKIFSEARIDELTFVFDDDVYPELLTACTLTILDENGNSVTEKFHTIQESNEFKKRRVVDKLEITLENGYDTETLESFKVDGYLINGETIDDASSGSNETEGSTAEETEQRTPTFQTVEKSNDFPEYEEGQPPFVTNKFFIDVDDGDIEEYQADLLVMTINDSNGEPLKEKILYKPVMTEVQTVRKCKLRLKEGQTLTPDKYTIKLSYINEPGLEGAQVIEAYSIETDLPFLSTELGTIDSMAVSGVYSILMTMSADLPCEIFQSIRMAVYDEDGIDYGSVFKKISDSTDFGGASHISELNNPNQIVLELMEGKSLDAGNYTFEFAISLKAQDSETDCTMNHLYTLWKRTMMVPYMERASAIVIDKVEQVGINKLKISLQNEINLNLIRNFHLVLLNEAKEELFIDSFEPLTETNNFGLGLMLTDRKYLMYQEGVSGWSRVDTSIDKQFNDICYAESSGVYVLACGGTIMVGKDPKKTGSFTEVYKGKITWNTLFYTKPYVIAFGYDGSVLRYNETTNLCVVEETNVKTNVASLATHKDDSGVMTIMGVGTKGKVIRSIDNGKTWDIKETGYTGNITGISYYGSYSDGQKTVTPEKAGWYASTSSGKILYSKDGVGWGQVFAGVSTSLQDIFVHNGLIIACGDLGVIIKSTNGVEWIKCDTPVKTMLNSIGYTSNRFIVGGSNGKFLSSKIGNEWVENTNMQGFNFRKVRTSKNQYDDQEVGSYFYAKLNHGETIGSFSIFTGTEPDPNNSSRMTTLWRNEATKKTHVGDIYYVMGIEDGMNVKLERWQYQSTDEGFKWVKSETGAITDIPSTGSYSLYLTRDFTDDVNIKDIDDDQKLDGKEIVTRKTGIPLTYLTSNPGCVHVPDSGHSTSEECSPVSIVSPDKPIDDQLLDVPYLQIKFDNADEIAMCFASFSLFDGEREITNFFHPIHRGIVNYGNSYSVDSILLPMKKEHLSDIEYSNKIQLYWYWTRFDDGDVNISTGNIFKKPISAITINPGTGDNVISSIEVDFNQTFPDTFLTDKTDKSKLMITPHLYCLKNNQAYSTGDDYIEYFKKPATLRLNDGKPSGFTLTVSEGSKVPPGRYIFIMGTTSTEKDATLEQETSFLYTSCSYDLTLGLQDTFPGISTVTLEMHENEVERIVDGTNGSYSEPGDPSLDNDLAISWFASGEDICKAHVGDIYINADDPDRRFAWSYDASSDRFGWKMLETTAHLKVSLFPFPSKEAVHTQINKISLMDYKNNTTVDLSSYLPQDMGEWDFSYGGTDHDYVSAIYLPLDVTRYFPGTENGMVEIIWNSDCIYPAIQFPIGWPDGASKLELLEHKIEYGEISYVDEYTFPPYLEFDPESGQEIHQEGEAGIVIHLTNELATDWLSDLDFSMIKKTVSGPNPTDFYEEDLATCFKSVRESNMHWFDETQPIKKTKEVRVTLLSGMEIDSAKYDEIKLFGQKSRNDIAVNQDNDEVVTLIAKDVLLNYTTAAPPEDMKVTLGNKSWFAVPVLTIEFLDNLPPVSAILNYTLQIIKTEDGKDYSDCFCGYNEKSVSSNRPFTYTVEDDQKVSTISIPMKDARILLEGNYEVKFYFSASSTLTYVNLFDKIRKFTISGGATITPLGKVIKTESPSKTECNIHVQFDRSVETLSALQSSQIGKALGITSYEALFRKLKLSFKHKGKSTDYADMFKGFTSIASGGSGVVIYKTSLRNNKKINPGDVVVKFTMGGSLAFREGTCEFKGCILNKVGKATKDPVCYIVKETRGGKTSRKVYKSYAKAKKRIAKLKKLNTATSARYKMCKKCRKIKLLTTSKIKAQIEKLLIKDGNAANAIYQAAEGYYFDIMAPKLGCNQVMISQEDSDTDGYSHIMCDNYVSKNLQYTWLFKIATMAGGKKAFPGKRSKSKRIYFYYIIKNGVQLDRGFKANKKGKKTKTCKKYGKTLSKYIKNYKKKVSKCRKCKKRAMAKKSSSGIGWSGALFPDALRTYKSGKIQKKMAKYFNKFYVNGKKKIKKKKNPLYCKKSSHKFKLVKKNNNYCRLSCANVANADKTLEYGCYKATFKK